MCFKINHKVKLLCCINCIVQASCLWRATAHKEKWKIFHSLHYYRESGGNIHIKRSKIYYRIWILWFGALFFSQNWVNFKKHSKLAKNVEKQPFFSGFSKKTGSVLSSLLGPAILTSGLVRMLWPSEMICHRVLILKTSLKSGLPIAWITGPATSPSTKYSAPYWRG